MPKLKTASELFREAAFAKRLTFDKTGKAHTGKNHRLCLPIITCVRMDKIQEFVDLSVTFTDEAGISEFELMSHLQARWVDVLEFQNSSAIKTLEWETSCEPGTSTAAECVRLFDWLKFLDQQPPPDS